MPCLKSDSSILGLRGFVGSLTERLASGASAASAESSLAIAATAFLRSTRTPSRDGVISSSVAHDFALSVLGLAVDLLGRLLHPLGDRGLVDGDLGLDLGGNRRSGDLALQASNEARATPRLVCVVEHALDIDPDHLLGIELPGVALAQDGDRLHGRRRHRALDRDARLCLRHSAEVLAGDRDTLGDHAAALVVEHDTPGQGGREHEQEH